ncbi:MAG: hypothetical protein PVJ27_01885 [Candidatus Brocadiaceae bacterium]|jgi:hypothetical protein
MGQQRAGQDMLSAAEDSLDEQERELLAQLHRFTWHRASGAQQAMGDVLTRRQKGRDCSAPLHGFLRECWEALDGLAREVNLVMHHLFPHAGLYPPSEMTRQCTFYMVRKKLHEHPQTREHPVSRLLWERTRAAAEEPYERLSFLYNLSLFLPVPVREERLPGWADLPGKMRTLLRESEVTGCAVREGTAEILEWLAELRRECYRRLAAALSAGGRPTR